MCVHQTVAARVDTGINVDRALGMSRGRISVGAGAIEEKNTGSGHRLSVVGAGEVPVTAKEKTREVAIASASSVPAIAKEQSGNRPSPQRRQYQ